MGKTNPLSDADMRHFVEQQSTLADSPNSWTIDVRTLSGAEGYDLSVKNPNAPEAEPLREPAEILQEVQDLDEESAEILNAISELI